MKCIDTYFYEELATFHKVGNIHKLYSWGHRSRSGRRRGSWVYEAADMICYPNLDRAGFRGSWGSGCGLRASICSRDGRSSWCSRGRDG